MCVWVCGCECVYVNVYVCVCVFAHMSVCACLVWVLRAFPMSKAKRLEDAKVKCLSGCLALPESPDQKACRSALEYSQKFGVLSGVLSRVLFMLFSTGRTFLKTCLRGQNMPKRRLSLIVEWGRA